MSCGPATHSFRLLDAFVGWEVEDKDSAKNLTGPGLDKPEDFTPEGLQLAFKDPGAINPGDVLARIPPARLARGCGPCDWYLATPQPASQLLKRDACSGLWTPVWLAGCDMDLLLKGVAVAARGRRVAVTDEEANIVRIWADGGERLTAAVGIDSPGPIAFTPWGDLLATVQGSGIIRRFGVAGEARGVLRAVAPGDIDLIAVSDDCAIWLVTRTEAGSLQLFRALRDDTEFKPAYTADLNIAFGPTGILAASPKGFCLQERGADGQTVTSCFSWCGKPIAETEVAPPAPPARQLFGQLLTGHIDSGLPRCRWHRVRIEADVPSGTTLSLQLSTNESCTPPDQGVSKAEPVEWQDFPPGKPHTSDWQTGPKGSLDFMITQPPGRYLFLRLRLTGDGVATPTVHRLRIDLPRVTNADFLPPVYREIPQAEDFLERFLSLFDASIADLDRAIERYPALLDPTGTPDEVLPWLGSFLDVAFDPAWEPARRRAILQAIPAIYRLRGTVDGLARTIKVIFDVEPVIQELPLERNWGGLGYGTRLRAVRLFGKARARFRLGGSALSQAPLRSYGDPDTDPLTSHAYRFRIMVPPGSLTSGIGRNRLENLVASQKPAHTVASLRMGGSGFVLGKWSAVGVDTVFAPLPSPVLGEAGNIRLRRMSVLWPARRGVRTGIAVGRTAAVGSQTVME